MIKPSDRNELIELPGNTASGAAPANEHYGFIARSVYATSYYLSFGVVFPTLLVASALPSNNAVGWGLRDGALAAGEANRRAQARTAAAAQAAKHKLGDAYANVAARVARRVEAVEDAVAQRRYRRRAATA